MTSESQRNLVSNEVDSVSRSDEPVLETRRAFSVLCNPLGTVHRFIVFAFICFLSFGNYFCYDTPASLQGVIQREMEISDTKYGLLYSVYSWPNVFLSVIGGYLIDQWLGVRLGAIVFASFVAAGQLVVSLGAFTKLFWLMILGRFIFAIGGESLAVAQNTYTVKWFKGQELNTVFGIQLSFARIGSTVNQLTMLLVFDSLRSPRTTGYQTLGKTLFIAFLTAMFSLACGFVLNYFDKRRDNELTVAVKSDSRNSGSDSGVIGDQETKEKRKFHIRDIAQFPVTFWLMCILCVTFYAAVFPLVSFGQQFYVNKFDLDIYSANLCNSLLYFVSIPASIAGGILVDYVGRNVLFMFISISLTILGHVLLAFTFLTPFVSVVILGCAYSLLASCLWPSVSYVVPENAIASAYGVMQSVQNFGLAILFILIGMLVDSQGYLMLELLFIALLSLSLAVSVLLYFVDSSNGGLLNMDGRSRKLKR